MNPGDVVAADEPHASLPVCCCYRSVCSKTLSLSIRCTECLIAFYCSDECLLKDKDGHSVECPILFSIRKLPGNSYINALAFKWLLKVCNEIGIEKYCSILNNLDNTKIDPEIVGFDENGQFKSDNFFAAYSMRHVAKEASLDISFFFNCIAVEILEYLMLIGLELSDRHLNTIGDSLVIMLSISYFNCVKIPMHDPSITKGKDTLPTAFSLYPSIGLFNHSCDPNVKHSGVLSDKTRVLKAIQPIPKGCPLFISYGITFTDTEKISRSSHCENDWKFKCTCQPCLEDWPVGRFIPKRITSLNLINPKMANIVMSECKKFIKFQK